MTDAEHDASSGASLSPEGGEQIDSIPETYELETLEQLRAIADELRTRIVEALAHRPMTVTQLGELLGQAPAKIHYHVRELERVGLVRLVATREKSGILEKYYRAVARSLTASKTLLTHIPADETFATMRAYLDRTSQAFLQAAEFTFRNQLWDRPKVWGMSTAQVWVTHEEMKALLERIQAEFDAYSVPRGVEGEEERTIVMMGYDPRIAESAAAGSQLSPDTAQSAEPSDTWAADKPAPKQGTRKPRSRHMVVAGAFSIQRSDLEEAMRQNRQLDISALGVCTFADDITPELVEQAISRFRHRGVLNASSAVREALRRKE
jgi:DNA-binding transcriptional ArsR family regulator